MEDTVTISRTEYNVLMLAQHKLDFIRNLAAKDKLTYGYCLSTSLMIDFLLDIERKKKKPTEGSDPQPVKVKSREKTFLYCIT